MKEKTKHYLLGAMILMCMIVFGTKNETYALSTYLPEEYYSDVVEKEVTLQKLQDGAKADSDDKYLVADHSQLLNSTGSPIQRQKKLCLQNARCFILIFQISVWYIKTGYLLSVG